MKLNQLRHLIVVAETGSFIKAAERLHLTQPALSRSIQALERELGAKVFDRIGWNNELTPLGAMVIERARTIVGETDDLAQDAKVFQTGNGSTLKIGLGPTPAAFLTVPLMLHVATNYPKTELHLSRGNIELQLQALRQRSLDALVVSSVVIKERTGLRIEEVPIGMRGSVVFRSGHPLAGRSRISLDVLHDFCVITTPVDRDAYGPGLLNSFGLPGNLFDVVSMTCDDVSACLDVVRQSDCVYVGLSAGVRPFVCQGGLVEVPVGSADRVYPLYSTVMLQDRSQPPLMRTIRQFIADRLTEAGCE